MASARNNRRRRRGRGRLGPLFKLLCVLAVVVALTLGATVFFQVETVAVSGNNRYTEEKVVQASGIQLGDNLFHMNKNQVARQIRQQLPYIGEVTIRRSWPSTIVITVTEWDAVARVEAPPAGTVVTMPEGEGEASDSSVQEEVPKVATEDWLINVKGKLLEPAPADSTAILVSGITPIMPRAGTMLAVPPEEQVRYDALLALLDGLEERGMMQSVSAIRLSSTQVEMRYLDRFDVKMPLNSDFIYKLRALEAAVAEAEKSLGEQTAGTFDLTQEEYTAVYSPD
ncbi:cell division protein FtsQ/DivIB [Pseudoflavonifractor phocaeensis]|uniref:cell division protein FtsQ/DivIB n=1 Tax=Pseudoflavonifractor phocaeensis TaxID=1870988 RepID=UPI001F310B9A|nr:FtsQ-type POTRA domain-containing protein [Pseudoflavonifractor phocaeensis]MCF2596671.1 FtsQ-type POTRA domain-containing protein [Pseudoflavonifractor phocaeensis]